MCVTRAAPAGVQTTRNTAPGCSCPQALACICHRPNAPQATAIPPRSLPVHRLPDGGLPIESGPKPVVWRLKVGVKYHPATSGKGDAPPQRSIEDLGCVPPRTIPTVLVVERSLLYSLLSTALLSSSDYVGTRQVLRQDGRTAPLSCKRRPFPVAQATVRYLSHTPIQFGLKNLASKKM